MNKISRHAAPLAATLALAGLGGKAQALPLVRSVPPASFLEYHVDTVPQLTFEVTYDPVVQARLAHHFHLSGPAMCTYVRDNLALKRLAAPYRTRVYCISPRGREYFVVMTLKRGTPIFALRRTGEPILRLACGNPLVAALPPTPKKAAPLFHPHTLARTLIKPALLEQVTGVPAAPVLAATTAPAVTVFTATASQAVFTSLPSAIGTGWLSWVPVAGGFVGVLTNGGSSGTPFVPTHGEGTTPVPEPTGPAVFLLGALSLGVRSLRRRR